MHVHSPPLHYEDIKEKIKFQKIHGGGSEWKSKLCCFSLKLTEIFINFSLIIVVRFVFILKTVQAFYFLNISILLSVLFILKFTQTLRKLICNISAMNEFKFHLLLFCVKAIFFFQNPFNLYNHFTISFTSKLTENISKIVFDLIFGCC